MASSLVILLSVSLVGVPHKFSTRVIWSIWSSPGKRGRPVRSSAIIHPTDQMSTVCL